MSLVKSLKKAAKKVTKTISRTGQSAIDTVRDVAKGDLKGAFKNAASATSMGAVEGLKQTGMSTDQALATIAAIATGAAAAGGLTGAGAAGATSAVGGAAAGGLTGTGTAALSGGAAGLASGILSGAGETLTNLLGAAGNATATYAGAKYAADKSAQSAEQINERQIAWERERATNAHQWEIQDLKNAGLNPVLSAGGQGAATGGISAVQPDTSGYQSAGQAIKGFFELLNSNRLANAQADNINAQTVAQIMQNPYVGKQAKATLANTMATTKLNNANSAKAVSDINLNAAKAVEAISSAQFNKRRASGKYINGQIGAHGKIMGQEVGGNIGVGIGY